jgi:uncharacterized protein (UPF0332 family)
MAEFELEEVQTYLILAEEKLVVARDLLSLGHYRDVVAKAYYTMFYAAKAALLTAGAAGVRRHTGVVSFFAQHFVKTGKIDRRYSASLSRALSDRIAADYQLEFQANEDLARRSVADAETFLAKAREIVAEAVGLRGNEDVDRPA